MREGRRGGGWKGLAGKGQRRDGKGRERKGKGWHIGWNSLLYVPIEFPLRRISLKCPPTSPFSTPFAYPSFPAASRPSPVMQCWGAGEGRTWQQQLEGGTLKDLFHAFLPRIVSSDGGRIVFLATCINQEKKTCPRNLVLLLKISRKMRRK